jgi:MFS family permease
VTQAPEASKPSRRYSNYVLFVLVLVYVFNFIDRQILSILAEDLKADLGLSDASIGFLYGTAFAVFYAIFGIPLGRLADVWVRKSLISIGLFFWSAMTALSGTAGSFGVLAAYRIGVGVGESSASPAAFSMLGDYFPPRLRATAVSIYSSGVYIGSGIGIFLGGLIVDNWNESFPDRAQAPLGLVGWQAAFFAVGVPGLIMSLWVWTLREPVRGASEGLVAKRMLAVNPIKFLAKEMGAVLPGFALVNLGRLGGTKAVVRNLAIGAGCALGAWLLILALGSTAQWVALAIGLYSFFSWLQGIAYSDHATFSMIYKSRSVVFGMIGFAWLAFVGYGLGFWAPPYFQRVHGVSASEAGTILGLSAALGGWMGVTFGGVFSDIFRRRNPKARLWMGILTALLSIPVGYLLVTAKSVNTAYAFNFLFQLLSPMWIGSAVALSTELVMPRMRASASAFYILAVTFIGLALGPYTIGQISDRLAAAGRTSGEALSGAMLASLLAYGLAIVFLFLSSRSVVDEETHRLARAEAMGEAV